MNFLTLIMLLFFLLPSEAQKVKTKIEKNSYFKEIYQIDKDSKLKNGAYVQLNPENRDTLCTGSYIKGERIGLWKFYSKKGALSHSYDYNSKSFRQFINTGSDSIQLPVMRNGVFPMENVDREPFYLGYRGEFKDRILLQLDIEKIITLAKNNQGISVLSLIVDPRGQPRAIRAEETHDLEIAKMLMEAIKKVQGTWLPAVQNGIPVSTKIYLLHDLRLSMGNTTASAIPEFNERPGVYVLNTHFIGVRRAVPSNR